VAGAAKAAGRRTLILVLSDNGASQEGGPLGFVNAMGPYNFRPEPIPEKLRRLDEIGGPDTHSNFPHGWAMASNTPLRRYKQNTHGGGIRDPFVMSWPKRIAAKGELRHQFVHACDLVPTLLDLIGIAAPKEIAGLAQMPIEGESFARSIADASAPSKASPQYFEMFGHRGLWQDGWKAVAYHPPGTPFENDKWELFHLDRDFSETEDLASHRLGVRVERLVRQSEPAKGTRTGFSEYTLLIDGEPVGAMQTQFSFHNLISWSGLDIGRDRGSPVSHYTAPFEFTGRLSRVTVAMHDDQKLDGEGVGNAQMARQ